MRLVLRRTAVLLSAGACLGALAGLAIGGLFSPILYGVSPRDPGAFAIGVLVVAGVAMAAGWLPGRRATSIEPASALRED